MMIATKPSDIATCIAIYLKAGDLDGIVSMFHPDCLIFFPPSDPPKIGLEGARDIFKAFVRMQPTLKSTITNEVINGDIALIQATWEFLSQEGELLLEGSSTEVAKKLESGGWGYLIDCPTGLPAIL